MKTRILFVLAFSVICVLGYGWYQEHKWSNVYFACMMRAEDELERAKQQVESLNGQLEAEQGVRSAACVALAELKKKDGLTSFKGAKLNPFCWLPTGEYFVLSNAQDPERIDREAVVAFVKVHPDITAVASNECAKIFLRGAIQKKTKTTEKR